MAGRKQFGVKWKGKVYIPTLRHIFTNNLLRFVLKGWVIFPTDIGKFLPDLICWGRLSVHSYLFLLMSFTS